MSDTSKNFEELDAIIEPILRAGRIPGAAIAVIVGRKTLVAKAYGYRDLHAQLPATADTAYPIASTTKAFNATLIGMLVDEGKLAWDEAVQNYLPSFRLGNAVISSQVTLRDLLIMRTGLPRHDWMWIENPIEREDLVSRLRYLELSTGFRERFQYNNLTATTAGYIAEIVTGERWEDLVRARILVPLGMRHTGFGMPRAGPVTLSYHENSRRQLKLTTRLSAEVTGPSGGSIYSTVEDMAVWMFCNLSAGKVGEQQLIKSETLAEIHAPQVSGRSDPGSASQNETYCMGWFVDTYNGRPRLFHGGYLHDVHSEVALFPKDGIGIVTFTNFGFPALAGLINQHVFDHLVGLEPEQTVEQKLSEYERKIADTRVRNQAARRVPGTSPSHELIDYVGIYMHPAYGDVEMQLDDNDLMFRRGDLVLSLRHWHYDAWIARDPDCFFLHAPHAFDRASRILFETNADGDIIAVLLRLEPAAAPIRFEKRKLSQ